MTTTKNYYTSSNYTSSNYATIKPMPTREEFHRYASNLITIGDFDTDHSNGCQIEKVDSAIKWTIKKSKEQTNYSIRRTN